MGTLIYCLRKVAVGPLVAVQFTRDGRAERSADGKNGFAYLKLPDPTHAVAEDEPLPSPQDRPLNQPRSNSGVSRPERAAPQPAEAGHHRSDKVSQPRSDCATLCLQYNFPEQSQTIWDQARAASPVFDSGRSAAVPHYAAL